MKIILPKTAQIDVFEVILDTKSAKIDVFGSKIDIFKGQCIVFLSQVHPRPKVAPDGCVKAKLTCNLRFV
ncbi:MAG: hypothetical protein J6Q55_00635 [Clostridia bacterium]|nr:hypothetical protein [Clostridia bacterium]